MRDQCIPHTIEETTDIVCVPLHSRRNDNLYAIIDAADAEMVLAYRWHPLYKSNGIYAYAKVTHNGRRRTILMHRLVLGLTDPEIFGDHINHETLDNRRSNLQSVTPYQNTINRRAAILTSRFRGVSWETRVGKWRVDIKVDGKKQCLGRFDEELEAAHAYDRVALPTFGPLACNFPPKGGAE